MSTATNLASVMAMPEEESIFVTMRVDGQLFGIDVRHVRDVLRNQQITPIPLAPDDVAGSLNSRGRIVTVLDVRKRLGIAPHPESEQKKARTFVVVDVKNELYSLLVDDVGDVLTLAVSQIENPPANIGAWKNLASGIYKLKGELLMLIDIHAFLRTA